MLDAEADQIGRAQPYERKLETKAGEVQLSLHRRHSLAATALHGDGEFAKSNSRRGRGLITDQYFFSACAKATGLAISRGDNSEAALRHDSE